METNNNNDKEITPKVDSRIKKYFIERKKGKTKAEASLSAGYADDKHAYRIERTKGYQKLDKYYKDVLLEQISMKEIAQINVRNMKQERDISGSNAAMKLALEKIEQGGDLNTDDERVVVVLRS